MRTPQKPAPRCILALLLLCILSSCTTTGVQLQGQTLSAEDLLHEDGFYAFVPLGLSESAFEQHFGFSWEEMNSAVNSFLLKGTPLDERYIFYLEEIPCVMQYYGRSMGIILLDAEASKTQLLSWHSAIKEVLTQLRDTYSPDATLVHFATPFGEIYTVTRGIDGQSYIASIHITKEQRR